MEISLPAKLEEMLKQLVAEGHFDSTNDAVAYAVCLMHDEIKLQVVDTEKLRALIQEGLAQADAGQLTPGEEVFEHLRRRNEGFAKKHE